MFTVDSQVKVFSVGMTGVPPGEATEFLTDLSGVFAPVLPLAIFSVLTIG